MKNFLSKIYRAHLSKKYYTNINKKKKVLDQVSKTFCSAKWLQSSISLHNGMTHSCHHPPQHKILESDIMNNPSGLHNTKHKITQREAMIHGKKPSECSYCWNIEDLGGSFLSDRILKSTNIDWSINFIKKIKESPKSEIINPTYLEISFDNKCNLKCAYCSPDISSSWMNEIKKYGPYPTSNSYGDLDWVKNSGRLPLIEKDNIYIKTFWKWWPYLYKDLKVFRLTGGEPLLSSNTWKILKRIERFPKKDLILSINTNLSVKDSLINQLIVQINLVSNKIKKLEIHTSCEGFGKQAEYIRFGMNYKKLILNIEKILFETNDAVKLNITMTVNALSVPSLISFLEHIKELRAKYTTKFGFDKLTFSVNYLSWPSHLSLKILPITYRKQFVNDLKKYIKRNKINSTSGYLSHMEVDQLYRLCEYSENEVEDYESQNIKDFKLFIKEYDKRKRLNFDKVFPELSFLNIYGD